MHPLFPQRQSLSVRGEQLRLTIDQMADEFLQAEVRIRDEISRQMSAAFDLGEGDHRKIDALHTVSGQPKCKASAYRWKVKQLTQHIRELQETIAECEVRVTHRGLGCTANLRLQAEMTRMEARHERELMEIHEDMDIALRMMPESALVSLVKADKAGLDRMSWIEPQTPSPTTDYTEENLSDMTTRELHSLVQCLEGDVKAAKVSCGASLSALQ
jgi:hypothetical protein